MRIEYFRKEINGSMKNFFSIRPRPRIFVKSQGTVSKSQLLKNEKIYK